MLTKNKRVDVDPEELQRLNSNIETLNDLLSEFTRVFGGAVRRSDEKREYEELRRQFINQVN